jgi:hypothetical protein
MQAYLCGARLEIRWRAIRMSLPTSRAPFAAVIPSTTVMRLFCPTETASEQSSQCGNLARAAHGARREGRRRPRGEIEEIVRGGDLRNNLPPERLTPERTHSRLRS